MKIKIGDLIQCESDLAEILDIHNQIIAYRWFGINDNHVYSYDMPIDDFEEAIVAGEFKIIPCDSDAERLVQILKYS